MGFRKPFRAPPVRLGPYYRAQQQRASRRRTAKLLGIAGAAGLVFGLASLPSVRAELVEGALDLADRRSRAPQPGDSWAGCDQARAAGTAPIYDGEPGYREGMDGDGDGIACEPYRN